jgi:electron transfer flavoprotein alpha subunit
MADVLVYCDREQTALELISKGRELAQMLGLGLAAAALGPGARETAGRLAGFGAGRVYAGEDPALEGLPVDVTAEALRQIAQQAEAVCVLLGSTRRGKELAPRLAQKLGAGCVTDANALEVVDGELVAERYAFGGATIAREVIDTPVKVFAVMPKTFQVGAAGAPGTVVTPSLALTPSKVRTVDRRPKKAESVSLDAAARIVGVGRGIAKQEDLALAQRLAEALRAELGCSRGISDFGWLSEERLIGLSGVKTKPDLYVAVGVSGQIQHTVGISGARVIVAINKDKDAPIFQLADYGIVGDLYQVVPALIERLAAG